MREALRAGEEELKGLRAAVQEGRREALEIEVELVRKQAELKFLDETSRKELNCAVAELEPESARARCRRHCRSRADRQEVRNRIEVLGAVNPAALEEFQEAQPRQEFLSVQRQDLIDSIRDTEKAIQEIDEVSRQKFAEAFEAINGNFREIFQTLFGGGTGEMRLTTRKTWPIPASTSCARPPARSCKTCCCFRAARKRWRRWPC